MAKRISSSSINWTALGDRIVGNDKATFLAFKSKSDKFLRLVVSQPAELPKIDWNHYKSKITTPGLVDTFQKSYESLKIPYPSDQGFLAKVDKDEADNLQKATKQDENTIKKIEELKVNLKKLEGELKFSEMSVEEFIIARPEFRLDVKPRLWPQFVDRDLPDEADHKPGELH